MSNLVSSLISSCRAGILLENASLPGKKMFSLLHYSSVLLLLFLRQKEGVGFMRFRGRGCHLRFSKQFFCLPEVHLCPHDCFAGISSQVCASCNFFYLHSLVLWIWLQSMYSATHDGLCHALALLAPQIT